MAFKEKLHFFLYNESKFPYYARKILNRVVIKYFKAKFIKIDTVLEEQEFISDLDHYIEMYDLSHEVFKHKMGHVLND